MIESTTLSSEAHLEETNSRDEFSSSTSSNFELDSLDTLLEESRALRARWDTDVKGDQPVILEVFTALNDDTTAWLARWEKAEQALKSNLMGVSKNGDTVSASTALDFEHKVKRAILQMAAKCFTGDQESAALYPPINEEETFYDRSPTASDGATLSSDSRVIFKGAITAHPTSEDPQRKTGCNDFNERLKERVKDLTKEVDKWKNRCFEVMDNEKKTTDNLRARIQWLEEHHRQEMTRLEEEHEEEKAKIRQDFRDKDTRVSDVPV